MFEWDAANLSKIAAHQLAAVEVESVFSDDLALAADPQLVDGEARQVLFGLTSTGRIVRVIYTLRGEHVRVITAHTPTRGQQQRYWRHRLDVLKG